MSKNLEDQLTFVDYKKPRLEAGDYTFEVKQHYGKPGAADTTTIDVGNVKVRVAGERIGISPETVFAQYPPPGESGDFRDTLPHVSFKKGSLPWMRSAYKEDKDGKERYEPWLYLLLINEEDIALGDASTMASGTLATLGKDGFFPALVAKSLQKDTTFSEQEKEIVTVEIKKSLFDDLILNDKSQIEYLAHVRRRFASDDNGDGDGVVIRELSVLIANRFGQNDAALFPQGTRHYAIVVSLEDYLDKDSGVWELKKQDKISLIVLHSWWFNCVQESINFEQRVQALDADSLRLPAQRIAAATADIAPRLDAGLTALAHEFRLGDRSVSWYRGPLIPCDPVSAETVALNEPSLGIDGDTFTATDADKLLLYSQQDGMFDISYAAAYELGRFLSVNHSEYYPALARYKRGRARYITLSKNDNDRKKTFNNKGLGIKHLPYNRLNPELQASQLTIIKNWLLELASLTPLPSWYVIADSALVPRRSLRTFNIDPKWLQSLWLGALSLHARPKITIELFRELYEELKTQVSWHGVLLRSDIVWAYPQLSTDIRYVGAAAQSQLDLAVLKTEKGDGYDKFIETWKSTNIRSDFRFAHDTHLYLTDQPFNYISLSLPPESLHYGADIATTGSNGRNTYTKAIKYNGQTIVTLPVPLQNADKAIVDITKLAIALSKSAELKKAYNNGDNSPVIGSARIGRFMLEGEPKAEFSLGIVPGNSAG